MWPVKKKEYVRDTEYQQPTVSLFTVFVLFFFAFSGGLFMKAVHYTKFMSLGFTVPTSPLDIINQIMITRFHKEK